MEFSKPPGSAFVAPRRVFTAPTFPTSQQNASSSRPADGSVDTLYDHPSAKIVAFAAGSRPTSIGPRSGIPNQDVEPGTLSWSSQLERTIAVGPFRIYRAPGSVAFLSCGSALQPILPKSQAWCVDESSSKFVLQIRRPQYWRIEIPVLDAEDAQRAQLLREVFDKILQFEKTECPFKRTFTVELPEQPQTPIKKRPWTPVQITGASFLPPTPITPPVEVARCHRGVPNEGVGLGLDSPRLKARHGSVSVDTAESFAIPLDQQSTSLAGEDAEGGAEETHPEFDASPEHLPTAGPVRSKVSKLTGFYASRCVTAPPQLALAAPPPLPAMDEEAAEPIEGDSDPRSPAESQDSFYTPQSFQSAPLPPSPPSSQPGSPLSCPPSSDRAEPQEEPTPQEDTSDVTIASIPSQAWSTSPTASTHSESSVCGTAPSSVYDVDLSQVCDMIIPEDVELPTTPIFEGGPLNTSLSNLSLSSLSRSSSVTTRRPQIRHRATTSSSISPSRRALSPLPPAANLFSPRQAYNTATSIATKSSTLAVVRRLPMAVIQKTCEILMSPPSHLLNLMLKVAARIAAGEWRGVVFGTDDHGEQIPVQWDWSDDETNSAQTKPGHRRARRNRGYIDDDWLPRGSGRMAGSFPESDDDEEDYSDSAASTPPTSEQGAVFGPTTSFELAERMDLLPRPGEEESDWSRNLGVD